MQIVLDLTDENLTAVIALVLTISPTDLCVALSPGYNPCCVLGVVKDKQILKSCKHFHRSCRCSLGVLAPIF